MQDYRRIDRDNNGEYMKSTEFLTETLDTAYELTRLKADKFDVDNNTKYGFSAEFTTANNVKYIVIAYKIAKTKTQRDDMKKKRELKAQQVAQGLKVKQSRPRLLSTGGIWEVHFYSKTAGEMDFSTNNAGDAFKVFGTVFAFIDKIVTKIEPDFISIKGKSTDDSRISLYKRMADKYATQMGYNITKIVKANDMTRIGLKKI